MKIKEWIKNDWNSIIVYIICVLFAVIIGNVIQINKLKKELVVSEQKYTELLETKSEIKIEPIPEGKIINITGEYDSISDAIEGNTIKYYVTVAFVIYDYDVLIAFNEQLEGSRE